MIPHLYCDHESVHALGFNLQHSVLLQSTWSAAAALRTTHPEQDPGFGHEINWIFRNMPRLCLICSRPMTTYYTHQIPGQHI